MGYSVEELKKIFNEGEVQEREGVLYGGGFFGVWFTKIMKAMFRHFDNNPEALNKLKDIFNCCIKDITFLNNGSKDFRVSLKVKLDVVEDVEKKLLTYARLFKIPLNDNKFKAEDIQKLLNEGKYGPSLGPCGKERQFASNLRILFNHYLRNKEFNKIEDLTYIFNSVVSGFTFEPDTKCYHFTLDVQPDYLDDIMKELKTTAEKYKKDNKNKLEVPSL